MIFGKRRSVDCEPTNGRRRCRKDDQPQIVIDAALGMTSVFWHKIGNKTAKTIFENFVVQLDNGDMNRRSKTAKIISGLNYNV